MQPTDFRVWSVFVSHGHEGREEERAWHRTRPSRAGRAGRGEDRPMNDRLMRVLTALGSSRRYGPRRGRVAEGLLTHFGLSTQVLFSPVGERARVGASQAAEGELPKRLKLYITGVVAASALALVVTTLVFPIDPMIGLAPNVFGAYACASWSRLLVLRHACGVRTSGSDARGNAGRGIRSRPSLQPRSSGGPTAAVWVALVGTTEVRELRGRIPWYGNAGQSRRSRPARSGGGRGDARTGSGRLGERDPGGS